VLLGVAKTYIRSLIDVAAACHIARGSLLRSPLRRSAPCTPRLCSSLTLSLVSGDNDPASVSIRKENEATSYVHATVLWVLAIKDEPIWT
jgi:hypothetical protein